MLKVVRQIISSELVRERIHITKHNPVSFAMRSTACPLSRGDDLINLTAYPTAFGGFLSAFKK